MIGLETQTSFLIEIGIIIIIATLLALALKILKQPLIPSYIITGIILGPLVLGLIKDIETIRAISELGIAFLLFLVGMEINLKKLKSAGLTSSIGATIQVALVYLITYTISLKLGFSNFESMIIGFALSFSSTMIVIQLLSETEEIDTLHGRISLGWLLIQDVLVIIIISLLSNLESFSVITISYSLLKGLILIWIAFLSSKFFLPKLFRFAAKSSELLFLTSITVLFLFAIMATLLDISLAIGAFLAGLTLANLPYKIDIIGNVKPLKNFFTTIFFVFLGMQLIIIDSTLIWLTLILLAITLIIKPIIITLITALFGFGKRTSFLVGSSLAQMSEFSLIIISLPFISLNLSPSIFSMIIFITIITMTLTSYTIKFEERIYLVISRYLSFLDKISLKKQKLEYIERGPRKTILLIGCHRMGSIFYKKLRSKKNVLILDQNPETINSLIKQKISCMYGDMTNKEILDKANLKSIKLVISTVPSEDNNKFLIDYVKSINPRTKVFVTANHLHQAYRLYNHGADYVILPHILSGERISNILVSLQSKKTNVKKLKEDHLKRLTNLDISS